MSKSALLFPKEAESVSWVKPSPKAGFTENSINDDDNNADTDKRDPTNAILQIKPFKVKDEFFFIFTFDPMYDITCPKRYSVYYLAVTVGRAL